MRAFGEAREVAAAQTPPEELATFHNAWVACLEAMLAVARSGVRSVIDCPLLHSYGWRLRVSKGSRISPGQ